MKKILSNSSLKIIACIAMLIDHIGAFLLSDNIGLRIIGRISFPIFAFCLIEGWTRTKDKKKYVLRLSFLALITEIIYIFLVPGLNVLFTFLIGFLVIWFFELLEKSKLGQFERYFYAVIFFVAACVFAELSLMDYGWYGIATVVGLYVLRKDILSFGYFFILLSLMYVFNGGVLIQLFSIFAILLMLLYNGKRGLKLKWSFYVFYPLHLFIIFIIMLLTYI